MRETLSRFAILSASCKRWTLPLRRGARDGIGRDLTHSLINCRCTDSAKNCHLCQWSALQNSIVPEWIRRRTLAQT